MGLQQARLRARESTKSEARAELSGGAHVAPRQQPSSVGPAGQQRRKGCEALFGWFPPAALLPVTTPSAALAAGDLGGLLPAATRLSRRQATATTTTRRETGRGRAW